MHLGWCDCRGRAILHQQRAHCPCRQERHVLPTGPGHLGGDGDGGGVSYLGTGGTALGSSDPGSPCEGLSSPASTHSAL